LRYSSALVLATIFFRDDRTRTDRQDGAKLFQSDHKKTPLLRFAAKYKKIKRNHPSYQGRNPEREIPRYSEFTCAPSIQHSVVPLQRAESAAFRFFPAPPASIKQQATGQLVVQWP